MLHYCKTLIESGRLECASTRWWCWALVAIVLVVAVEEWRMFHVLNYSNLKENNCTIVSGQSIVNIRKQQMIEEFEAELENYITMHKRIVSGLEPPRYVVCLAGNGYGEH